MLGYRAEEVVGARHAGAVPRPHEIATARRSSASSPAFDVFVARPAARGEETRELTYVRKDGTRLRVSR